MILKIDDYESQYYNSLFLHFSDKLRENLVLIGSVFQYCNFHASDFKLSAYFLLNIGLLYKLCP